MSDLIRKVALALRLQAQPLHGISTWVSEIRMPLRALRYLAAIALLPNPAVVRAEAIHHVDLVCNAKANLALVRFAISEEHDLTFPRLPKTLDRGLSASKGSRRTDCTLGNGTTIRIRGGEEQTYEHGAGGANPPAFFSMWINQRKVLSRKEWKPGYFQTFSNLPIYDGVLIAANHITICATIDNKPQRCTSEPLDLTKAPIDLVEYGSFKQKTPVGHISVIAKGAANQRFCKAYLGLNKSGFGPRRLGSLTLLDINLYSMKGRDTLDSDGGISVLIKLSPGVTRRLMVWDRSSHYFDGTVIAVAPSGMAMQDIAALYPNDDIDEWPKRVTPPGVTLISGGQKQLYPNVSPRYVHLVPQRINGSLYVFAYPTNSVHRPTAALVRPLADGGFTTVCAFNRTEPHY